MNVGDLVRIKVHGNDLCLITKIRNYANWRDDELTLYFFTGVQRLWVVSSHHVELINECG